MTKFVGVATPSQLPHSSFTAHPQLPLASQTMEERLAEGSQAKERPASVGRKRQPRRLEAAGLSSVSQLLRVLTALGSYPSLQNVASTRGQKILFCVAKTH
jgi:hypothetical protein